MGSSIYVDVCNVALSEDVKSWQDCIAKLCFQSESDTGGGQQPMWEVGKLCQFYVDVLHQQDFSTNYAEKNRQKINYLFY